MNQEKIEKYNRLANQYKEVVTGRMSVDDLQEYDEILHF